MKRTTIFSLGLLMLVIISVPVAADPSFSLELLPLGVHGDQIMVTPDMFVKLGADASLFTFLEYSGERGAWFENNVFCWTPSKVLGLRTELGIMDNGASFWKVGPRFTFVGLGFDHLQIVPLYVSGTPDYQFELLLYWQTRSLNFSARGREFGLRSEGFIRTLRKDAVTYGQPQLWLTPKGSSVDYGIEAEVIAGDRVVRGGVRKRF